jgi:hypothetical protein
MFAARQGLKAPGRPQAPAAARIGLGDNAQSRPDAPAPEPALGGSPAARRGKPGKSALTSFLDNLGVPQKKTLLGE